MSTFWMNSSDMPVFGPQSGSLKTDVLIVGGGMAGILCAYLLKHSGVDCLLVEAKRVCAGITANTTAKITSQHGLIYSKLMREFGVERAALYLRANEEALEKYRELCTGTGSKNAIDCNFEQKAAYTYTQNDVRKIARELYALDKIGFGAEFAKDLPLPFPVEGAVKFENQAQFNALKFVAQISKDLNIRENTKVLEFDGQNVVTNRGSIKAKHTIIATHFPIINKHGMYFAKLYQHRSYVLALKYAPEVNGMYADEAKDGLSFRNYEGMLLLGGGSHRTGKSGGNWTELDSFAKTHYPHARECRRWATQDCMSLDGAPYIGLYSKNTPHMYVATGFNKWGMTSSMVAATLLTDIILGKKSPYEAVFSPSRTVFRTQLFVNLFESTTNLLTFTGKRCPHMACALKWNPVERSWDCPCHGSRFAKNGELKDNPATDDLKQP